MKLSALFFFRRIFYYERAFTIANTIMIVVIILWSLAFLLAEIFVCGRYEETLWRHDGHAGSCVNQTWLNLWFAITDVVTDVAVMSLPYPVIAALGKLSRRERAGVMAVFMLGAMYVESCSREYEVTGLRRRQLDRSRYCAAGFHIQSVYR